MIKAGRGKKLKKKKYRCPFCKTDYMNRYDRQDCAMGHRLSGKVYSLHDRILEYDIVFEDASDEGLVKSRMIQKYCYTYDEEESDESR
jgi:hypothetical protein